MGSGGARPKSGPPPGPDSKDWINLPAEGCSQPVPVFPLVDPNEREFSIWNELWTRPQAIMWHRQNQEYEVALYVRRFVEVEQHSSAVSLGVLVRQMADSLGLTTPGLRSNRWRVVEDVIELENKQKAIPSAKERFKALPGGQSG